MSLAECPWLIKTNAMSAAKGNIIKRLRSIFTDKASKREVGA
jgi:hypothetical protein